MNSHVKKTYRNTPHTQSEALPQHTHTHTHTQPAMCKRRRMKPNRHMAVLCHTTQTSALRTLQYKDTHTLTHKNTHTHRRTGCGLLYLWGREAPDHGGLEEGATALEGRLAD